MSAIWSVNISFQPLDRSVSFPWLPARLDHAGNLAPKRHLTEADPADPEITDKSPGPAAPSAAVVLAGGKFRLLPAFVDHRFSRHN
jgi:hypothetical protein